MGRPDEQSPHAGAPRASAAAGPAMDVVLGLWTDPVRRAALDAAERAALPPHPAGEIELATELPQ